MARKRNEFDYSQTCPDIDKAIAAAKHDLVSGIYQVIEDVSPLIPPDEIEKLAKQYADKIYSDIGDAFETVRETNSDMRDAANKQISDLLDEIENLKYEISNTQNI